MIRFDGAELAVFYPGQGASLATVSLERVLAAGVEMIVACGGAGALVAGLALGQVIVVDSALRDEGTSYHYPPPSREVTVTPEVVQILQKVVDESGLAYTIGKAWTTDGFFRETPGRIRRRREEGCIVVDAEAVALLAVAEFRGISLGQLLFAGDDVSGGIHSDRGWIQAHEVHQDVFQLAAQSALRVLTTLR